MGLINDFFGAPQATIHPVPNNQVQQQVVPQPVEQPRPRVIEDVGLVKRNWHANQVVMSVQQNNFGGKIT